MREIIEIIKQPWPWYISGPLLTFVMFLLFYFGKTFGFSSNLRTICSAAGAGKVSDFFRWDWKAQKWNLMFLTGSVIGGFISSTYLMNVDKIQLAQGAIESLTELGFENVGENYLPSEIYGVDALSSVKGIALLLVSGILVGFGTRYAGGCTSGHAITGLSNLQFPSLIATLGFFTGGLIMTYFGLPFIFN